VIIYRGLAGVSGAVEREQVDKADGLVRYTAMLESQLSSTMTFLEIILIIAAFTAAARLTNNLLLDIAAFLSVVPLSLFCSLHTRHLFAWNPKPRKAWHLAVMLIAYLISTLAVPLGVLRTVDGIVASQIKSTEQ
jgi:hypothetical protein